MRPSLFSALAALVLPVGCAPSAPSQPALVEGAPDDDAGAREDEADAGAAPLPPPPSDAGEPPEQTPSGCGRPSPEDGAFTLEHGGRVRRFHVRLPPSYDVDTPTPLVVSLHGRAVSASSQETVSGFSELAAQQGFIVVYPEGIGVQPSWNAGVCCGEAQQEGVDDVGFLSAMLDALEAALCIDEDRVFFNGLSNGGFMTNRVACELADRVAAAASVAGVVGVFPCSPSRPVPMLHFHGTADDIVPYDGNYGFSMMSAPASTAGWAERNGCAETPSVSFELDDVTCETWSECDDDATVTLCTIEGGGHQWPGGVAVPFLGPYSDTISATDEMWSFFAAHPRAL